ncbi:MAG: DUF6807 family protein [Acidimicrobiia bacterium]|nr:DUF6807 family protein [Acidimicrobiia bacterium]
MRAPAGPALTVDAPDDHPWHHGLWFTIKYVNGENFWEELEDYGVLRHRDDPPVRTRSTADALEIAGGIDWIRPDRETVVIREERRFTHTADTADAYHLDVETTLTPTVDVVLDRTPFDVWVGCAGGLAFRGRPDLRAHASSSPTDGETQRIEGEPAEGLDLSGTVDGVHAGVALLDAPDNPRHPVWWYGSTRHATYAAGDDDWSNFVNAAFLFHEPLEVAGGDQLRLRYRVVVHDGLWTHRDLSAATDRYRQDLGR